MLPAARSQRHPLLLEAGLFIPPSISEAVMPATMQSTPQLRATYALAEARKRRHHPDCRCRMWNRVACNAADALWTQKMDVELERIAAGDS